MIYPDKFEEKIGFDTIRLLVKEECRNNGALNFVDRMKFSSDYSYIKKLLCQTDEYRRLIIDTIAFPDAVIPDLTDWVESVRIPGSYLEPENLLSLHDALINIDEYISFFKDNDNWPLLAEIAEPVDFERNIVKETGRIFDIKGEIKDNASSELASIRRDIDAKSTRAEKTVMKILREASKNSVIPTGTDITVRNGRSVIPVPASRKKSVKGVVHDESSTGQTLFIEPTEVFELNNEVKELKLAERREIIKILISIADLIRPYIDDLIDAFRFTGTLDFIRAKAKLSLKIDGVMPLFENNTFIDWHEAKHPLLFLSLKEQKREIVTQKIRLDNKNRILVISGPNAGGKSVCMKTAGLLQYMLQCGLLIPVKSESEAGLFSQIFIDIGDEQSIENDLSTYSSHLIHMKNFVSKADDKTLFLVDEFGSGTEPAAGGAIAEAVLEALAERGAFGVVTTHYANLKLMSGKVKGIVNGAMLFDAKMLKPLYKLSIGKPGSSFAFEIASNTGFSEVLLDRARNITGHTQLDFDQQLQQLDTEKVELEKRDVELKVADTFLAEMIDKYENLYADLKKRRTEIIAEAKNEAKSILNDSNSLIEKTIKEIKEAEAEKEKTKAIREKLPEKANRVIEDVQDDLPIRQKPVKPKQKDPIKNKAAKIHEVPGSKTKIEKGSWVKLEGSSMTGEITEIKGEKAIVTFGNISMKVSVKQLAQAKKPGTGGAQKGNYTKIIQDLNDKMTTFSPEIDLRGKRAAEAIHAVNSFIDEAVLLNVKELRVLHGKGDGILRQVIRDLVEGLDEVASFGDEHIERGGHGVTLISLI